MRNRRRRPITRSTKADVSIGNLSGQSNIELRGAKVDEDRPDLILFDDIDGSFVLGVDAAGSAQREPRGAGR